MGRSAESRVARQVATHRRSLAADSRRFYVTSISRSLIDVAKRGSRALGLEVQRLKSANTEEAITRNLLQTLQPAAVLDVGANVGQFATGLRRLGYAGLIVSFEALPSVHAKLTQRAAADSNWVVAPCAALGSSPGTVEINVAANTASSSVLPMLEAHRRAAPQSQYVGTVAVPMARLDELSLPLLPSHGELMLKIDTQGYEREVLRGATAILNRVAALQVELSLVPLYEGAPTLADMVVFVERLGFELFNLAPGFKEKRSGRLLQADGFFVRQASLGRF
jgi:FkbM family methyltransferase